MKFTLLPTLLLGLCLTGCGIQFQDANLYEGVAEPVREPRPERLSLAVEPVIFQEDATNFWLPEDGSCTTGRVEKEIKRTGDNALKIEWNRDPAQCEWAGFGIGWDNWLGKDLSTVFDDAAIQMYARTISGKMYGLPVVLTLEDYSGNMAWSYVGSAYFDKYYLDEEWQKVEVPLNTFDLDEDGLDITNVKQLMFELQQSGGVYLDDIQLVYYEEAPQEIWLPDAPQAPTVTYPVQLFDDTFINDDGWGFFSDDCQTIEYTDAMPSEGDRAIHATWDASRPDCYRIQMGVSWTDWFSTDLTDLKKDLYLVLDLRGDAAVLERGLVRIGFEDYQRGTSLLPVNKKYLDTKARPAAGWQTFRVPVRDLPATMDFSDVKQVLLIMDERGEVYLDNLRLEKGE